MGARSEAIDWAGPVRETRTGGLTPRAERTAVKGALRGDVGALDLLFAAHWPAA